MKRGKGRPKGSLNKRTIQQQLMAVRISDLEEEKEVPILLTIGMSDNVTNSIQQLTSERHLASIALASSGGQSMSATKQANVTPIR